LGNSKNSRLIDYRGSNATHSHTMLFHCDNYAMIC